jgi:predicted DNA-binding antitoxin AbrB/MazE fold protein
MKVKTKDGEEITLEFMDSFFESFNGTDEELQKLMEEIISKVQNGTLMEDSEPVDFEEVDDDIALERKLQ